MGNLQPISKRDNRKRGISLTIGMDGRMYLSKGLQELLGHRQSEAYFLFYDHTENRIGISKSQPDPNIEPFSFNARGEGTVVSFVEDCEIQMSGQPLMYLYEGREDDLFVFYPRGRKRTSFKQEMNGNLERIS